MLPLIIAGFTTLTIGVALLILGEVPVGRGKRMSALRSRLVSVILLSFLPLAWGARQATLALLEPETVDGLVVSWSIFGVCWAAAFAVMFRALVPKRTPHGMKASNVEPAAKNPFGATPAIEAPLDFAEAAVKEPPPTPAVKKPAATKPPAKKAVKPAPQEDNPFDFS